jgi:hypothetical protein
MSQDESSTVSVRSVIEAVAGCCRIVAVIGLFLATAPAQGNEESIPSRIGTWNWSFTIGVSSWASLTDLESVSGESFDSYGFALELAGHKTVTRRGPADVLVGAALRLFTTDGDIAGISGERGKKYLNLEAGFGWYNADFAELDCETGSYCVELRSPYDSSAFGAYVGLSGGMGRRMIAGLKVHFADFGSVKGVSSISGDLEGPIYIFSLGAVFGD